MSRGPPPVCDYDPVITEALGASGRLSVCSPREGDLALLYIGMEAAAAKARLCPEYSPAGASMASEFLRAIALAEGAVVPRESYTHFRVALDSLVSALVDGSASGSCWDFLYQCVDLGRLARAVAAVYGVGHFSRAVAEPLRLALLSRPPSTRRCLFLVKVEDAAAIG